MMNWSDPEPLLGEKEMRELIGQRLGNKYWAKWRSIDPKKPMTEQQARLLIIGGLRP